VAVRDEVLIVDALSEERQLTELNLKIAEAERSRDEAYLESVLDNALIFRRADGTRATKEQYLAGIRNPENTYSNVQANDIEVLLHDERLALVSLVVRAAGVRGGKPFEGAFRNARVFVKNAEGWQCVLWFNTRESTAAQ
jgi:ketosteroid isomerase-like protein